MKRVRSTLNAFPLRSIALATCFATASGLAWAQDEDTTTEQLLEGIQNGERVEISLPDPEKQLPWKIFESSPKYSAASKTPMSRK